LLSTQNLAPDATVSAPVPIGLLVTVAAMPPSPATKPADVGVDPPTEMSVPPFTATGPLIAFAGALNRRMPSPVLTNPPAAPETVDEMFSPSTYGERTRPSTRGAATSNVTGPVGSTNVPPLTAAVAPVIPVTEIAVP
jgi:hypothetical protein